MPLGQVRTARVCPVPGQEGRDFSPKSQGQRSRPLTAVRGEWSPARQAVLFPRALRNQAWSWSCSDPWIFVTVFNHTQIPFPARLGGAYHSESARLPSTRPVPSPVPRQVRPRGGNLAGLTRRARVSLSWIRVLVPVVRQGKSVHGGGPSAPGPVQSQG